MISPEFQGILPRLQDDPSIVGVSLCGSYGRGQNRKQSDIDLFLVGLGWNHGNIQVVHYSVNQKRLDAMLFDYDSIINAGESEERLLNVLLRKSQLLFSKDKILERELIKYAHTEKTYGITESEKQSFWYNVLWNLNKAGSYQESDPLLAQTITMESYYFIGLCFARLHGKENYSYAESLKFMRSHNSEFWEEYITMLSEPGDKIKSVFRLLSHLPESEYYLGKDSFIELDSFISPLTVVPVSSDQYIPFQLHMDKLVLG